MSISVDSALKSVRTGILALRADGANGFEGLLRLVLTKLTDIPFRIAASGLQGGMDGVAAMPTDPVCFEAKRYSKDIPRTEILTKIIDLSRKESAADRLWILGATSEVSAQLASAVEEIGDKHAISTFVLDWTAASLPLLAVAVVYAGDEAIDFIIKNREEKTTQPPQLRESLEAAFSSVATHPDFFLCLDKIKSSLNVSQFAFKVAVGSNHDWRKKTFGSTRYARECLGQGLAVLKDRNSPEMRNEIRGRIKEEINADKDVILIGDEGQGKSWLAAQICCDSEGLALFVSAEQLEGVSVRDLDEFLIHLMIKQTGGIDSETVKTRWRHRLKSWRTAPSLAQVLVIIDGLNQRQTLRWDKLLNGLQTRLSEVGGRMIVTVRPHFWQQTIAPGLIFTPKIIKVPEWSPEERDTLLSYHGISLSWLDQQTLQTLQNPRLLSVAVTTLPQREALVWKGLTTDRLLMEHLRVSQRENFENETFKQLTGRLSEHATEVLARVQGSSNTPPKSFQADSDAVVETRFFRPLPGPGDRYELRQEGLTLALGFTLVDQLWQTLHAEQDLAERVTHLVEPINAMDRTADVLFASLLICALDNIRFETKIFSVLLDAFANLQNVDDRRFAEFAQIVILQPAVFFQAVKTLCLERGRRINHDWFIHAAFEVARSEAGSSAAEAAIHDWLHCYNKDPVTQTKRYHGQTDDEYEKRFEKRKIEIEEALSSLSGFEEQLLERMTELPSETDELITLALKLLKGRSLASFSDSFVAMGLGFALDKDMHCARRSFQQLITFNRVDRTKTKVAFLKAIEPLRTETTSRGSLWTVVRMLQGTGDEADAEVASQLAEELRKDGYRFEPPSPNAWRQIKIADANAIQPVDLDKGIQDFNELDPGKFLQSMGLDIGDHRFREFLPVACRFKSTVAIKKTRELLSGLIGRTGLPLRQLLLNCEEHIPLMKRGLAKQLIDRVAKSDSFAPLPKKDQPICQMFAFYYAAAQLSSKEQLDCITNEAFGPDYLVALIPSLKQQSIEGIATEIISSLSKNNEHAMYGALAAALHGNTRVNREVEELILKCSQGRSSKVRSVAFELATHKCLDSVRHAHIESNWKAGSTEQSFYEDWSGSMLLVEAYGRDEISSATLLDRMSKRTWFSSIDKFKEKSLTKPLVEGFLRGLTDGVDATKNIALPQVDLVLSNNEQARIPLLTIEETTREDERFPSKKDMQNILETNEDFDEKQNRLKAVATEFLDKLNGSDAMIFIQEILIEDLRRIVFEFPSLLDELEGMLNKLSGDQFIWLRSLAFAVANLISENHPEHAVTLLNRACSSQGFITQALEDDLTLEHQAVWGSHASKPIEALWLQRLLSSENDSILAQEVLAAERFGASNFIKSTILQLVSSEDSLDQANAISIASYSSRSNEFQEIIRSHINFTNLSGIAAKYALTEHDSAEWAKSWVEQMWNASDQEEFWRCLMIAKTTMDARICSEPPMDSKWKHFTPVFQRVRKQAIKERNKERKKRLLGQEAPEPIFITSV